MAIVVDREKYLVFAGNKEINLPKKEFELLCLLCSIPGKVFSRQQIFTEIWGEDSVSKDRTVDVHIVNIRKKLGFELIRTIKGVGFKISGNDVSLKENLVTAS